MVVAKPMVAQTHNSFVSGVLNILDGGAFVVKSSMLETIAQAAGGSKKADGGSPATLSLVQLLGQYGVNSPIVGALDQALSTVGAKVVFDPATNTYYITGVQVVIGNGAPQAATFVVSPTQISVLPGTITPTTPNPPPPLVTLLPPAPGTALAPGCRGTSLTPADVSNSVVTLPSPGTC